MATVATPPGRTKAPFPAARFWRAPAGLAPAPDAARKWLWWMTLALVAAGVVGRLVRYFLQFPVWGDEAFICFNLLNRDYAGLTRSLEYAQVAPLLFLWSELAAVRVLGFSELAMRLLPLLAGLASLGLFWRLARSTVPPLAAAIAVGLLAVSRWPVTMSTFVKPYSFDLLMALVMLVPAVEWLRRPQRVGWLAVLALAAPVALLGSYPAVFVAGAVSLALLPAAWRSGWTGRSLFVAYNLLMGAAFLASYWVVGREQLDPATGSVNRYLQTYWADAFPPASPLALVRWLALIHTGRMMAYPFGAGDGGSTATFLLFAAGVWAWWKGGRRSLLVLWLTPFALNLLAAATHRYPYGGCCRLSQHLAPAVCLLAGTGAAALLERFVRSDALRLGGAAVVVAALGLCAAGGLVCDVMYPYRDRVTLWMQQTAGEVLAKLGPRDQLVVCQDCYGVPPPIRWYLESRDDRIRWQGRIDWRGLPTGGGLVTLNFWLDSAGGGVVAPQAAEPPELAMRGWTPAERTPYVIQSGDGDYTFHCEVCRWTPPRKAD